MPKVYWQSIMAFHGLVVMPINLILVVYSCGAMFILGQWQLFVYSLIAMFFFSFALCIIGIFAE